MNEAELLDRVPDAIVVIGPSRTIAAINAAAERLTGWGRDEAQGRPYPEVLRLRNRAGFLVHEKTDPFDTAPKIASGSPAREYLLYRRDGTERWVSLRAAYQWRDGRLDSVVATFRDTGRRRMAERNAYDLIATLAHDLRSPLTSVKGFTSTMLRRWERFSDEQKQHMLQTIDWDADRMSRLLKDLLDFSRLESGRLEIKRQPVHLDELAVKVAERVSLDARNHTIVAEFPEPFPVISADEGKIEQVFMNLVENAVKHGDPGDVRVTGELDGDAVTVRVKDSGPGIDAQHRPYVFTKFYRRGTGDRHAGTGLGLYICKGIIDAHGGEIGIEQTGPDGTVFAFTLPIGDV